MEGEGIFVRPATVKKGVWGRHGTIRIEDIPENRREDVIMHMMAYYFREEPITSVLRQTAPYSVEDIRKYLNNALNDNMCLYAVDEANNEKIAGVTMVRVASRCAPNRHLKVDKQLTSAKEALVFMLYCLDGTDLFTYDSGSSKVVVEHVLEPTGLSVLPQYRRKGIAEALIKARLKIAANAGIGATLGIYTSIYSQNIILRQPNMSTLKEIPYSEYIVDGKAKFAQLNPPHPSAKIIGGLISKDMA